MATKAKYKSHNQLQNTKSAIQSFVQHSWGKRPSRIPLSCLQNLFNEEILLAALKRYSEMPSELKQMNRLAEFVTGVDCLASEKPIYPFAIQSEELNLDAYLQRVDTLNMRNEWSIAYFGLHGASEEIWDWAKLFIKKLSAELGYRPGGRVDVDCFVGRYSSTPSGVHVDDAHNFGYTFRAGKTMYTWNPKFQDVKWMKSPAYDSFKKYSVPLRNDPEYVCYFPHDALHVGETKEQVSVNVNISFWKESEPSKSTQTFILSKLTDGKVAQNKFQGDGRVELSNLKATNLKELQQSIEDGSLEIYLAMNDLLEQTTLGLCVPRPVFNSPILNFEKVTRLSDSATLNWYDSPRLGQLLIGLNGHCISCPRDEDVLKFLAHIASGSNFKLSEIAGKSTSDLGALAQQLNEWGAFL